MNPEKDNFFHRVLDIARLVPYGKVTTYGAIAAYLGTKGSARMVGWAMNQSHHSSMPVPAHRVVNRNGLLTGKFHFGSPNLMQELLENEGFIIENDRIVNFKENLWVPGEGKCGVNYTSTGSV
jgi:methylated-DNA-protein-cysteine methyltransferase-like protein